MSTIKCLQALGVAISGSGTEWEVAGVGLGGLKEPADILDVGNSGTTIRLLAGLLAGLDGFAVLTGDASIRSRPMGRVVRPLREMGIHIDGRVGGDRAPLAIRGGSARGIRFASPVASAQIKSAVLLAALHARGETSIREPARSRDHTERMLTAMGAKIKVLEDQIVVLGGSPLKARSVVVPGDLSAAAFWLVGAATLLGSELLLEGVGLNPTRTGILDVLREMGAKLEVTSRAEEAGEPVGDLRVAHGELRAACIRGKLLVRTIDEVPILALAMACAHGRSEIRDAAELRVKESDRLAAIASTLGALGARIQELPDGLVIDGPTRWQAGTLNTRGDHRIAMTGAIAALLAAGPVTIHGAAATDTSYPGFWDTLASLRD